ncbi:protein of unknown function UPF0031 [Candidatus Koribacter versatilis Ellin345]|uniref:Bifunctional NAD(P)H-hydrate repair enzyme n=1 Tax=Koribacter versatilis (strain Ellin345) TaxID=204669 RepID=Q1ILG7_KORVE|nr:bifunctional ADP-dependent NAD(P)H-hydrate dehydratase/NAD(P)H-hydrate epimerase [Candidatus Koribacter versatilis]ABF42283.1 protein of unknown function UPF0031 [Candidatus Koribacter versatilis Ellin345]
MKIVTAQEMRDIDRITTERYGVPSLTLMENAGRAAAEMVVENYPEARSIAVVCGKGNNGGDGFVAARHLHKMDRGVEVLLLADPEGLRGDAAEMYRQLGFAATIVKSEETISSNLQRAFAEADVILDAVLGTGFKPPVSPLYAKAIAAMNASKLPIVAVDVPSGADSDGMQPQSGEAIARADAAVTFTAPKPVHVFGDLVRGKTVVAPIGSPDEAIVSNLGLNVITPADYAAVLAARPLNSNKGMYGHALIVAGSFGKSGAAAMAGMACLRAGAGLATVATPKSVLTSVASYAPELMTESLAETADGTICEAAIWAIQELAKKMTVLAIGPGLTQNAETIQVVRELVRASEKPMVIDADGLNALVDQTEVLKDAKAATIITPHPGEMSRLCGISTKEVQADRVGIAKNFAASRYTIVVLKGDKTVIAAPSGETWINCTGNPGMATGGTGDVLTGILTGLLAQHPQDPLLCAIAAVHLHGMAGDLGRDRVGEISLIATDLIHALSGAFERAKKSLQKPWVPLN